MRLSSAGALRARAVSGLAWGIKSVVTSLSALLRAAGKAENLPYTILGGLMLLSLVARVVLILS